jgi:uncharacterized protein (TIGR02598 family)
MKLPQRETAGFSLVEVVLALGVAAFCLIAVMGMLPAGLNVQQNSIEQTTASRIMNTIFVDLRANVRLPPGQASKSQEGTLGLGLTGHWAQVATPDTLFFDNAGKQLGTASNQTDPAAPAGAVFRAKITYLFPPNASTSVAKIIVSWPAAVILTTGTPAGSVETYIAINR